jgi:transcriptional regulator with XRE-family HTH domain
MTTEQKSTLGSRLRQARKAKGWSLRKLAEEIGSKASTLSSVENSDTDERGFKKLTAAAQALEVNRIWLETGKGPMDASKGTVLGSLIVKSTGTVRNPADNSNLLGSKEPQISAGFGKVEAAEGSSIPYSGEVRAGAWMEIDDFNQDMPLPISAHVKPEHQGLALFSVMVRGTSMNREFNDGTVLICASADNGQDIVHGDFVVIERRRQQEGLRERSLKQIDLSDKDEPLFWPRSNDPRWQKPLDLSHEDESLEVAIIGVVLYVAQRNLK